MLQLGVCESDGREISSTSGKTIRFFCGLKKHNTIQLLLALTWLHDQHLLCTVKACSIVGENFDPYLAESRVLRRRHWEDMISNSS